MECSLAGAARRGPAIRIFHARKWAGEVGGVKGRGKNAGNDRSFPAFQYLKPDREIRGGAVYFVLSLLRSSCADMQAKYYVVLVTLLLVFLPEAHAQGGDGESETHRAAFIVLILANWLIYRRFAGTERGGERKRAVQIFLKEICSSLNGVLQDKDEWGKLVKSVHAKLTEISLDRVAKDSEACDKFMHELWHYSFKTAEMLPTAHPAPDTPIVPTQEDTKFGVVCTTVLEISCGELVHLARKTTSAEEVEKWLKTTLLDNIDLMSSADAEINQQLDEIQRIFDPAKKESTLKDKREYRCKLPLDGSTEVMKSQVLQDDTGGPSLIVPSPHKIASPHEHPHNGPAFSSKEPFPTSTDDPAYESTFATMSSSEKTGSPQEGQDVVRESRGPSVSMPGSIQESSVVLGTSEYPQRSSSSEQGKSLLSSLRHSSTAREYFHELESMHRTGISTKELKQLERLLKCMEELMHSGEGGSEVISLSHHDSVSRVSHVELLRVLIANQVFLAGGGSQVCLLCNSQGPASRSTIDCHIFPECLLKVYRGVHNLQEECFIYDCVRNDNVGPKYLTYKLFCGDCDGKASTSEKMMKILYLEVNENYPKRTRAPIIDRQNGKWSIFYLITLMFLRGLIVNEDLMDNIYNSKHCKLVLGAVMWLLDFAKNRNFTEHPKIFQYLVPLEPLNKQLMDAQYCYNMHLRCLQFTRFYEEEEGPFLYMQFDFFHWILPLDDNMISYLQTSIESGEKALLTVEDSTEFLSEDQRKLIYPDILVRISGRGAEKLSQFLRSPPKLVTDHHRMFLGLHRSSTDSDYYARWIKPKPCQQQLLEMIDIEMTEEDCVKWKEKEKQPRPNSVHHLCSNQEIYSLQQVAINIKKEYQKYSDKLHIKLKRIKAILDNFDKEMKMLTVAVHRTAESGVEEHKKKMLELETKTLLRMEEVVHFPLSAMDLSLPASSASLPASSEVEPSRPPSSAVATEPSSLSSSILDPSLPNTIDASLPTSSKVEPSVPAVTALPESNAMHGCF